MDKDIFKEMKIEDKLSYINQELKQGKSLNKISECTISRKSIRNQFKKINYIFDKELNQYIADVSAEGGIEDVRQKADNPTIDRIDGNVEKTDNELTKNMKKIDNKQTNSRIKADNPTIDKDLMFIIEKKEKLMKLIENCDDIIDLIESDKKPTTEQQGNGIIITLPKTEEEVRKTFRVNPITYNEFDKFAKENKQFKIKDLVSQALKEFVDNHS